MFRILKRTVVDYWNTSHYYSSTTNEEWLITIIEEEISLFLDLHILKLLARVSSKLSIVCMVLTNEFKNIILGVNGVTKCTPRSRLLYKLNGHYTKGHSTCFVTASYHHLVDYMNSASTKVSCSTLNCPVGCTAFLSKSLRVCLLHPDVVESLASIPNNLTTILQEWPDSERLLPWLFYSHCDASLVCNLLIKNKDLLTKYSILLCEYSSFEGYWSILYDKIVSKVPSIKVKSAEIYNSEEALNYIRLILSDSDSYFASYIRIASIGLSSFLQGDIVTAARILQPRDRSHNELKILHFTTIHGFALFFDQGGSAHTIIFAAAAIALQLATEYTIDSYWSIPTPIGIEAIAIILHSALRVNVAGTYESFGGVTPYVKFVVLTYLLGIPSSIIIISDNALIPIGFKSTELFTNRQLMVSDIIFELGGRRSSDYLLFRAKCIELLCQIRKHYVLITTLIGPALTVNILKEVRYRWVPENGGEALCIANFIETLDKSAKGSFGFWSILGY